MPLSPRAMPALVSPFDEDGEIDLDAHAHNVAFLSDVGIEGFVLGGSNGEGPYLDPGERQKLLRAAREVASDGYLMLGIMAETVRNGLRQLEEAEGADSVLVLTPTTMARNRSPYVLNYFRRIADASPLPVYLYSVPPNTAYSMPVELVAELADHPNVVGMKDSSGDVVRLQAIVDATPDDFVLYSGASAAATAALTVGCHGVITGSINYAPRLVLDVVEKAPNRHLQSRLTALSATVERHGVPGVKAAAAAAGLRPGLPRLPLEPAGDELCGELERLVREDPT
ncbi:MAG TPA: dihydrodipicolinate synthase family protein [Acidimicrobiia bacterium]|nr:dihydrodipicolinate synthase family protein [Acidimicrobiia bacterium]